MNQLTLLQINDTHSYLESHPEIQYGPQGLDIQMMGGFSRISGLVESIRRNRSNSVLLFDNGDTFHGTYEAVDSKGGVMVPVMNRLRPDAMTFHWDIAYGPKRLLDMAEELDYPILAGNVFYRETDELFLKPWMIREAQGLKIGIIGLASNIIDKTMPPKFSEGLYFTMGDKEVSGYVSELKEQGADLIVLLSHLGYPQDIELLRQVSGIDICLSGHTHNRTFEPVRIGDAWLIQSGSHGSFLGCLDISMENGKITRVDHELLPVTEDLPEDEGMTELINDLLEPYRFLEDEVVGETSVLLHRNTGLESPMDNLLLSALRDAAGAQLAFSNGWRYGVPIPAGPLTMKDLHRIIPVDPPVSTVKLTGQEVWDMLEENLEHTYARDSFDQMGGYVKRSLGIRAYIKLENPKGQRIQQLFLDGDDFDPEAVYHTVFVTQQGVPEKFGTDRKNLELSAIEALKDYLGKGPFDTATTDSFIVI